MWLLLIEDDEDLLRALRLRLAQEGRGMTATPAAAGATRPIT